MYARPDMTLHIDLAGRDFWFEPHTNLANQFLTTQFARIGDRDATMVDCRFILSEARILGFTVTRER